MPYILRAQVAATATGWQWRVLDGVEIIDQGVCISRAEAVLMAQTSKTEHVAPTGWTDV